MSCLLTKSLTRTIPLLALETTAWSENAAYETADRFTSTHVTETTRFGKLQARYTAVCGCCSAPCLLQHRQQSCGLPEVHCYCCCFFLQQPFVAVPPTLVIDPEPRRLTHRSLERC